MHTATNLHSGIASPFPLDRLRSILSLPKEILL